jgi:WD40 repeat protein
MVLPHGDKIEARSAAYSPDGKVLITGGSGGALNRWEVANLPGGGRGLHQLSPAGAIAFSPDGRLFATANGNHTVGLFAAEGDQVALLKGHTDTVRAVAFSPDSRWVASGSWDKTVRIWEVATHRLVSSIAAQQEPVNAVAFSPDGKLLATGTGDWQTERSGEVRLWDPRTGKLVQTVIVTPRDVKSIAFSPDGRKLAIACGASEGGVAVVRLDVRARDVLVEPVARLNCPTGATAVGFSHDGGLLLAGQWNGKLAIWDAASLAPVTPVPVSVHSGMIFDLALSPDGKHVATAGKDGTVKIWSIDELIHRDVTSYPLKR